MWYRIINDKLFDYADYEYEKNCLTTDIITQKELDDDKDKVIIKDGVLVLNPDYANILMQRELDRVSNLHCTKRVLALILKELGVSYANLQALIATNEDAQLEWDLCVELERSNPLLDVLGAELGISSTTIDKIFKYANGEISKEDFDETDIVKGGIANG